MMLALLAVIAMYGRDLAAAGDGQADLVRHTVVADIDRWRSTNRERTIEARYDFSLKADLKALPLQVGEWQGADIPQTNVEVAILLEPEQYVYRRYTRPDGKYIWLSLIGSRQTKSFHSPQICYTADGWQTDVTSEPIGLDDGSLYMLRVEARKDPWEHIILYTFLYPDTLRRAEDGAVLFKVTAPLYESLEETVAIEKSFIREFFHSARL